jgi:Flp pilus assembly protein TadG
MIEMAVLLPLLVLLLLGAMHYGFLFYIYNGLEKSVRDGGRYAANRAFDSNDVASYRDAIKNVVVCGRPDQSTCTSSVRNLTVGMVTVTPSTTTTRPDRITIQISGYTYSGPLDYLMGSPVTLQKPSLSVPFLGRFIPPGT